MEISRIPSCVLAVIAVAFLSTCSTVRAQSSTPTVSWRLVPQALPTDPTDPEQIQLLNKRGAYFDKMPGDTAIAKDVPRVPLDQPQPQREGGSSRSYAVQDELPFFRQSRLYREAIVVARFESSQAYLTPSRLSVYTDVKMSVEQVLMAGISGVQPGKTIDILLDGGSVRLNDGRTITSHIYSEQLDYTIKPGHRYVLFLDYESNGNFFRDYKDWELTNGKAMANRADEVNRFREGRAQYSGLNESDFIDAVRKAILAHEGGN